jgi:PAT family beta-lactamase induction signal transducer AmpG
MTANRRIALMFAFGFASGLPLLLCGGTLALWLTSVGTPVTLIGTVGSIGIAYSLKMLWAFGFDYLPPPLRALGRRRGWLLPVQLALMAATIGLALTEPATAPLLTMGVAALVAFLSASQDIVIDAWRIESFGEAEQGRALALYIWGYRMAMLAAGSGAILASKPYGWHAAMLGAASLGVVGLLATLLAPEPPSVITRAGGFQAAVAEPLRDLLARPGALVILAFVALFKLGEALAGVLTVPFYKSLGFTTGDFAIVIWPGLAVTILGYMFGGLLVRRFGVRRALLGTGVVQTAAMGMYVVLAAIHGGVALIYFTIVLERLAEGTADAAFLTFLSGLCARQFSASQYALLSSLAALGLRTISGFSGLLQQSLGWTGFYTLAMLAALPAMALMLLIVRRYPETAAQAAYA